MAITKAKAVQSGETYLSPDTIERIDLLVGSGGRAEFIRDAVNHALFLAEYLEAHCKSSQHDRPVLA